MIIADVMDEIGAQLETIPNLNVLPYEADDISVPASMVSLPVAIDYLGTYGRGMHSMDMQITTLVAIVGDQIRRDQIAPYGDGSGDRSIKAVLEKGTYSAFDTIAVARGRFTVVSIARVKYLGVLHTANVAGPGSV